MRAQRGDRAERSSARQGEAPANGEREREREREGERERERERERNRESERERRETERLRTREPKANIHVSPNKHRALRIKQACLPPAEHLAQVAGQIVAADRAVAVTVHHHKAPACC